jgi:membrane-associated phospholipid phosphatase
MMVIRLPLFIDHHTKYLHIVALALSAWLLYGITNHLPPLVTPRVLPFTPFEQALPLLPWTIWPYLTCFVIMVLIAMDVREMENLQRLVYAFLILQLIANFTFLVYPVSLPRDLFPVPDYVNPATKQLFEWARTVDTEKNCLPSLHVADCCLVSLVYLRENRFKFVLALAWVILVSFSTLGTKQHYLWDIIGGIAAAIIVFALVFNQRVVVARAIR